MSKYGTSFPVSKELPSLLKAFTREVLREQPASIKDFGARYFSELVAQAELADDEGSRPVPRISAESLEQTLSTLFNEADVDQSGTLDRGEFKAVLQMSQLGLSEREAMRLMAEADVDENGEVSYLEFVPIAVELVQAMHAKLDADANKLRREADARQQAEDYLLHGLTRSEVNEMMAEVFCKSDADGSGTLSIQEFQKCLKDADLGFTRKEINLLMLQCDIDGDGCVSYAEFAPLCFELLSEMMKEELLDAALYEAPTALQAHLMAYCKEADTQGSGQLDPLQLKDCLKRADLGLTRVQLHSVLAEASWDETGHTDYAEFTQKCSDLIGHMMHPERQKERRQLVAQMQASGALDASRLVHGHEDPLSVEQLLMAEFGQEDATGSGLLPMQAVVGVLSSSQLELSGSEVFALLSAAELVDDEGNVSYASLAQYAYGILEYLAQNAAVSGTD